MFKSISVFEKELDANKLQARSVLDEVSALGLPYRWHPLGFIVCTVIVDGPWKLRVHIWPFSGGCGQDESVQIHDHIFDFRSWVLAGAVENIEYEESIRGKEHALYKVKYADQASVMDKQNKVVRLMKRSSIVYGSGENYSVKAGQLHETRRSGLNSAVTVLITRDVSENPPIVIGPITGKQRYEYARSIVEVADLHRIQQQFN